MFSKVNKNKKGFITIITMALVILAASAFGVLIDCNVGQLHPVSSDSWETYAVRPQEGNGGEADPFKISSAQELAYLIDNLGSGSWFIELVADIDLKEHNWTPIKCKANNIVNFNGNGHFITNLVINHISNDRVGFFAGASDNYTNQLNIKNLSFYSVNVSGKGLVGGLAGMAMGSSEINNVHIKSGSVTGLSLSAGGLVAYSTAKIKDCSNSSNVTMKNYNSGGQCGGIIGYGAGGTLIGCVNSGTVLGLKSCGGVVGEFYGTEIKDCINTGTVINRGNYYVGGLAGALGAAPKVDNCYVECTIVLLGENVDNQVGGLVGVVSSTEGVNIKNSGFNGRIVMTNSPYSINSLVGIVVNTNLKLENCFAVAEIDINEASLEVSPYGFTVDKTDCSNCYSYTKINTVEGNKEHRKYKGTDFSGFAYSQDINGGFPFPKSMYAVGEFIENELSVLEYLQLNGFSA